MNELIEKATKLIEHAEKIERTPVGNEGTIAADYRKAQTLLLLSIANNLQVLVDNHDVQITGSDFVPAGKLLRLAAAKINSALPK